MINLSFFIPAYNCATTIAEAVDSIFKANFVKGDEVIIVDDCSTDRTLRAITAQMKKHPEILLLKHPFNKGAGAARNTAIEQARNKLVFCLDSDNLLVPNSVRPLLAYHIETKSDASAFQQLHFFKKTPRHVTHKWTFHPGVYTLSEHLSKSQLPGASGNYLFSKQAWLRAGRYPEFVGALDSWSFGLRLLATGSKMSVFENTHYFHRFGHESDWVRYSQKKHFFSLAALQVIIPFLDLLDPKDIEYIMSKKGRYNWFEHIEKRPIRLRKTPIQSSRIRELINKLGSIKS